MKQPLRRFAEDRRKAIGDEIARLLATGFIMEVENPAQQAMLMKVPDMSNPNGTVAL